jgi:hypothetical protein
VCEHTNGHMFLYTYNMVRTLLVGYFKLLKNSILKRSTNVLRGGGVECYQSKLFRERFAAILFHSEIHSTEYDDLLHVTCIHSMSALHSFFGGFGSHTHTFFTLLYVMGVEA